MDLDTPALKRIQYIRHKVEPHRRHYVTEEDVKIVLSRLPEELWSRLRKVHFKDDAKGNRILGYTTTRGRREITICALPIRVSLIHSRAGGSPEDFGALRGSQWPVLAVRRYLLYSTLLHEIGHFQIILPRSVNPNRKFASETKAQKFANEWRERLWSEGFDHPDPVHNAPGADELKALRSGWIEANLAYKRGLALHRADKCDEALACCKGAVELYPNHAPSLELLGKLCAMTKGSSGLDARQDFLRRALAVDPTRPNANLWLAVVFSELGRQEEAREAFQKTIHLAPQGHVAAKAFANALSEWGCHHEAEVLFKKLLATKPENPALLRDYAWHLMKRHDEPTETELRQAAELLRKAIAIEPRNWHYHYSLAVALMDFYADREEAIRHASEALRLEPDSDQARELLAELTA